MPTTQYYGRIKQADGRVRRVPLGVSDKTAAEQLRIKLQREADHQKAGLVDPFANHRIRPLIGGSKPLPKQHHRRDKWGRITQFASELARIELQKAIDGSHLADYRLHLHSGGASANHVWETVRTIRRVAIACQFLTTADLNAHAFENYLAGLIDGGKSLRTRNAALKAMRAFVRWLMKSERLSRDPFAMLRLINEASDPNRRQRRALEPQEFIRLIRAAEAGDIVESVPGSERALLYLVAAWTGLRRKELAAITLSHLSLDTDPPFIHLPAAATKAKRDDQPIPLHTLVAEKLHQWLQSRPLKPGEPIFRLQTRSGRLRKTSKMMEYDCLAAGLPYVGDLGVADFHSHRVSFITNLCRSADFSTVVDLARHSDPKLTAKIYDRVHLKTRAAAINSLTPPS